MKTIRWIIILFVVISIMACALEVCSWERTCYRTDGTSYVITGTGTACGQCRSDADNGACTVTC